MDPVFILRLPDEPRDGDVVRVALKDLIDLRGTITTAGCAEVERRATRATEDAACIRGIRAAEKNGTVRIVGKTNLHELAFGADGINGHYGTPCNPLDGDRIPGGSSSGSAVAVATGAADLALGSDTGGSIRIPAACCGIIGLKTTFGRVPVAGTWGLAPTLDTIGPLARTVVDTITAMDLLEPGFAGRVSATSAATVVGRVRPPIEVDPSIDEAVDALLARAPFDVVDVELPFWDDVHRAGLTVLLGEAWRSDRHLLGDGSLVSDSTQARLRSGADIDDAALAAARAVRAEGLAALDEVLRRVQILVLPTMPIVPPFLDDSSNAPLTACTRLANMLGTPALSVPAPRAGSLLPAGLQLVGPLGGEELLLATASRLPIAG